MPQEVDVASEDEDEEEEEDLLAEESEDDGGDEEMDALKEEEAEEGQKDEEEEICHFDPTPPDSQPMFEVMEMVNNSVFDDVVAPESPISILESPEAQPLHDDDETIAKDLAKEFEDEALKNEADEAGKNQKGWRETKINDLKDQVANLKKLWTARLLDFH